MSAPPQRREGPLRSWYDIHDALRHEVEALVTEANALTDDATTLDAFDQRVEFLRRMLSAHSTAEDAVMFPSMARRGLAVDERFRAEHLTEVGSIYDLHRNAVQARFITDPVESVAALARIVAGTQRLQAGLEGHLTAEEEQLLPAVLDAFSEDEQLTLLHSILASNPGDVKLQMIPWIVGAVPIPHAAEFLDDVHVSAGDAGFAFVATLVHDDVPADRWDALVELLPALRMTTSPLTSESDDVGAD
jgi:hemerythrin-like domain-containing protein